MRTILIKDLAVLTADLEVELIRSRKYMKPLFFLSGSDNDDMLEAIRLLRGMRVPVAVSIDMSDPVLALNNFFDVAGFADEVHFTEIPEQSIAKFGQVCYDRLMAKATEVSKERGIWLTKTPKD